MIMLLQKQIIQKVKQRCEQDANVTSCMMYGSFTKGEGDPYSDVEFYIFLSDEYFGQFQSRQWVADVAAYDLMFHNDFDTEVVIFSNLIRGEFHFLPASKLEVIKTFKPVGVFPDYALITARLNQADLHNAYDQALHVAAKLMAALRPAYDFALSESMLAKLRHYFMTLPRSALPKNDGIS